MAAGYKFFQYFTVLDPQNSEVHFSKTDQCWKENAMQALLVQGSVHRQVLILHAGYHVFNSFPVKFAEDAASALRHAVHATHQKRGLRLFLFSWRHVLWDWRNSCGPSKRYRGCRDVSILTRSCYMTHMWASDLMGFDTCCIVICSLYFLFN